MKLRIQWVLVIYICFVFLQSLFFKFTGSEETVIIFSTISEWMRGIGPLEFIAPLFEQYGGLVIGSTELVACVLLVIFATRFWGALLALGVMSGAIFFHLFTPLGVDRIVDSAGNTDGGVLFYMACGVWICTLILAFMNNPFRNKSAYAL
ncbi:MAG: hypothetical protein JKY90_00750 [Gammaproteobacteria bacterium]|nr:hypothetical protein [Gammaproteobacteria bacterium]